MEDATNVLVQRRRLAEALTDARQKAGKTQAEAAAAMDSSLSKIQRIEKGTNTIKTSDLKELLRFYEITEQWDQLLALGREARKPPWWGKYRTSAPRGLLALIENESAASAIKQFETTFIPGILQTENYARAVLEAYHDDKVKPGRVNTLVELRTKRLGLLDAENPPRFHFVLDEPVIKRVVANRSVMREQLRRLVEVTNRQNVTIEILPYAAGLHPGMGGLPFEIIEFDSEDGESTALEGNGDVVVEETSHGVDITNKPETVRSRRETFDRLSGMSLNRGDSIKFLNQVADEMK
jgi:transcriptional regulator with XRE-family HTH domain